MSFSPTLFGLELARILNMLAALQAEESRRFNRLERHPLMAIFTNPVGTSWFEADMLTRHFYANRGALETLLTADCVPGARDVFDWRDGEGAGLTMLQVRQMLLSLFVELASSLQAGVGPALAPIAAQPQPNPEPPTRWPQRQHGGLYGLMLRQGEPPGYRTAWNTLPELPDGGEPFPEIGHGQNLRVRKARTSRPPTLDPAQEEAARWHCPSWEAGTSPTAEAVARGPGSREPSPAPPSPEETPVVVPRREPRWLLPRADSVPPMTPGSEEAPRDTLARREPPTLTGAESFAEPDPSGD